MIAPFAKFIDWQAQFVFLPASTDCHSVRDGTVYDVPGCHLGHHGEDVSFNSILKEYKLDDPALLLLGEIVRAADSHPREPHSAGEGLRWVAHGFSAGVRRLRCSLCGVQTPIRRKLKVLTGPFVDSVSQYD